MFLSIYFCWTLARLYISSWEVPSATKTRNELAQLAERDQKIAELTAKLAEAVWLLGLIFGRIRIPASNNNDIYIMIHICIRMIFSIYIILFMISYSCTYIWNYIMYVNSCIDSDVWPNHLRDLKAQAALARGAEVGPVAAETEAIFLRFSRKFMEIYSGHSGGVRGIGWVIHGNYCNQWV